MSEFNILYVLPYLYSNTVTQGHEVLLALSGCIRTLQNPAI